MVSLGLAQVPVGRRLHPGGDLQHAVESHHRPEPAVESEHELIKIALQVLRADPVVRSQEPRIEVPKDDVNHGEVLVRIDMVTPDRHGIVPIAQLVQVVVAGPSVRPHFRSRLHVGQDDRLQSFLLTVRDDPETQPACDEAAPVSSTVLRTLAGG